VIQRRSGNLAGLLLPVLLLSACASSKPAAPRMVDAGPVEPQGNEAITVETEPHLDGRVYYMSNQMSREPEPEAAQLMMLSRGNNGSVEWWLPGPAGDAHMTRSDFFDRDVDSAIFGVVSQVDPAPQLEPTRIDLKRDPYWNVWVEKRSGREKEPTFEALPSLEPETDYRLFLDLAALRYRGQSVAAGLAKSPLTDKLRELLAREDLASITLTALVVPNVKLFAPPSPSQASQELTIDLARIRKWLLLDNPPRMNGWETRKVGGDVPDFLFGSVPFELTTLPSAHGEGAVVVSLWLKGRPLAEVPILLCVADDGSCDGRAPQIATFEGDWSFIAPLGEGTTEPDASLHLVDLPSAPVGVFWCEACPMPGYKVWRLNDPLAKLGDKIKSLLGGIKADDQVRQWRASGDILFKNLFTEYGPHGERDQVEEDRRTARVAFAKFLASRLGRKGDGPLGRIFVRLAIVPGTPVGRLPLGIMHIRDILAASDLKAASLHPQSNEFLGFRFLIEAPLPDQSFAPSETCISRWFMALPRSGGGDTDLDNAVSKLVGKIKGWQDDGRLQGSFPDMPDFIDWLRDGEALPDSALAILSHHDSNDNRLFYEQNGPGVVPAGVLRRFKKPSLVILDGCKTGVDGTTGYSVIFNEKGFSTAIVTATNADPYLAGDFLDCFANRVDAAAGPPGRPVSEIFFESLRCAGGRGKDKTSFYGPNALTFMLLGNGNLRLCAPVKEPKV
jgi:hypothetical protein